MPITSLDLEDGIATGSANAVLVIGTSAVELKAGASTLSSRISLLVRPVDADLYIGSSSGVTTSNGFLIKKDEIATLSITAPVWGICGSANRRVHVYEFSTDQVI
jgi:hypothetical protein